GGGYSRTNFFGALRTWPCLLHVPPLETASNPSKYARLTFAALAGTLGRGETFVRRRLSPIS
ncbi:hypothetical protein OAS39_05520, partial [Pirellulales bacterium]|nr:hypothetical protein [Pirellulales bacterium]